MLERGAQVTRTHVALVKQPSMVIGNRSIFSFAAERIAGGVNGVSLLRVESAQDGQAVGRQNSVCRQAWADRRADGGQTRRTANININEEEEDDRKSAVAQHILNE